MSEETSKGSNVGKIIGCGCAALAVAGLLGLGGCFLVITQAFKNNMPYKDSIAAVQQSAAAKEALGEPIKPGLIPSGNISVENDDGTVDFSIPVSGPEGKGRIEVKGTKTDGQWTYDVWELRVDGRPEPIPLGR